jgi:hypothetical protein
MRVGSKGQNLGSKIELIVWEGIGLETKKKEGKVWNGEVPVFDG